MLERFPCHLARYIDDAGLFRAVTLTIDDQECIKCTTTITKAYFEDIMKFVKEKFDVTRFLFLFDITYIIKVTTMGSKTTLPVNK